MALTADQLNTIYQNVLFRNVDTAGIQFFANRNDISDAQVRQQIELSQEASTFVSPVVRLYQEVLGRVPDAAGLKFFSNQLRAGTSLDAVAQQLVSSAEFSAKSTAVSGAVDATDLSNTNQLVSDAFQSILGRTPASGEFAFFQGKTAAQILSLVAGSPEAASTNAAGVVTFLDSVAQGTYPTGTLNSQTGGAGGNTGGGQTFQFTANVDSLSGTAGNDTFIGDNTGATATVSAADSVNGGAGTDTVKLFLPASQTSLALPTLNSIEILNLNGGNYNAVNAAGISGLTSLVIDSHIGVSGSTGSGALTLTVANQAVTLANSVANTTSNAGAATTTTTLASTSDTAESLTLSKFGNTARTVNSNTYNDTNTVDLAGTKVATLNLTSTGGANNITLTNSGSALATLNVTGDQKLTLSENLGTVTKIDASANAAGVTITAGSANTTLAFTGGAGNDTLKLAAGTITSTQTLVGGTGTDTLVLADATINTSAQNTALNAVQSFEVLGFSATTPLTVDLTKVGAFTTFDVQGAITGATGTGSSGTGNVTGGTGGVAATFTNEVNGHSFIVDANLTGGAGAAVTATNNNNTNIGGTGGNALSFSPTVDNGSNALSLSLNGVTLTGGAGGNATNAGTGTAATLGANGSAVDASAFETVNIVSNFTNGATTGANTLAAGTNASGAAGHGLLVGANATVNVSGAANIDLGDIFSSNGSAPNNNVTLNAGSLTGNLTAVTGTGNDAITGGSGVNTITLGGGQDTLTLAASVGKADVITISSATGTTATTGPAITGFTDALNTGDKLVFAGGGGTLGIASGTGSVTISGGTLTATINGNGLTTFSGATSGAGLSDYVTATFKAIGSNNQGKVAEFQFGSDTYVVQARDTNDAFTAATDSVVKLVGLTSATGLQLTQTDATKIFIG